MIAQEQVNAVLDTLFGQRRSQQQHLVVLQEQGAAAVPVKFHQPFHHCVSGGF
uniref:Uncharacterized protein n=1 Tax=bioreactor metagenome TaxID=1076179 RepID=A0A645FIF3_9ZZZZ